MTVFCKLAAIAGLFFIGLNSVDARHHEGGNRGDEGGNRGDGNHGDMRRFPMGDHSQTGLGPPAPNPQAREIIEELLEEGAFSDEAVILIEHLLLSIEERQEVGEPDLNEFENFDARFRCGFRESTDCVIRWATATEEVANIFEELADGPYSAVYAPGARNYFRMVLDEYRRASRRLALRAEHQRRMEEQPEQDGNRRPEEEEEDDSRGKKAGSGDEAGDGGGFSDEHYEAALRFCHEIFQVLYPTGKAILNEEIGAAGLKQWNVDPTSAESILKGLALAIHEVGHGLNGELKREGGRENYYLVAATPDGSLIEFDPPGLTTPNSSDYFQGISRSAILLDTQNHKRPPDGCDGCILSPHNGDGEWGSDGTYSDLYLNGAPEEGVITHWKEGFSAYDPGFTVSSNSSFDSGDQGYGMLFEETVQYAHSLAWLYLTHDPDAGGSSSGKDAMLLYLWWNQRYLKLIREEYPNEHAFFVKHWAEAFLTVWGQAWRYLDTPTLNYNEDKYDDLLELVTDDLMLGEVQYVRELYEGGSGSELADASLHSDPDGNTWAGPQLSGPPLIVDSGSTDGDYYATMPEGWFEPEDRPDITEFVEKYDARLSLEEGGYGNTD